MRQGRESQVIVGRACACQSEKSAHGEKREQERSSKPAQPSSDHSIFFVSVYFSKTKEPAAPIGRPTQSPEPPFGVKVRFQPETTTTLAWSKISHKAPHPKPGPQLTARQVLGLVLHDCLHPPPLCSEHRKRRTEPEPEPKPKPAQAAPAAAVPTDQPVPSPQQRRPTRLPPDRQQQHGTSSNLSPCGSAGVLPVSQQFSSEQPTIVLLRVVVGLLAGPRLATQQQLLRSNVFHRRRRIDLRQIEVVVVVPTARIAFPPNVLSNCHRRPHGAVPCLRHAPHVDHIDRPVHPPARSAHPSV